MPIKPEFRHFYGKEWREVIRPRILARAGNRCEQCGKPDRERVECRYSWSMEPRMWWRDPYIPEGMTVEAWRNADGERGAPPRFYDRETVVRVVLTVAHLDHNPANMEDDNLMALCQWCHLHLDFDHHRETRQTRKDAARPLLNV